MIDVDLLKKHVNGARSFNYHNGLVCTEIGDGYCEFEVELEQKNMNLHNIAHGSLLFAMCDDAAGIAISASGRSIVTQSAHISFMRPGVSGKLRARSRRIKEGKTLALYESEVFDEGGKLLAKATLTFFFTGKEISLSESEITM